jgi:hypothetical protein
MVPEQGNRVDYVATASQTTFPYDFPITSSSYMRVVVNESVINPSQYLVTGVGLEDGGNVVLVTPSVAGDEVFLIRQVPYDQLTDYQPNDPFPAQAHESALDKLTMLTQQLKEVTDRCLQLNLVRSFGFPSVELPHPDSIVLSDPDNAKLIGWNELETNLRLYEMTGQTGIVVGDVIPSSTHAGLPAVGNPGRLHRVTDNLAGIWIDSGVDWYAASPIVNALAFPGVDLGAKVMAAMAALPNAGGTVVVPPGEYTYGTEIFVNNAVSTKLHLMGYGATLRTSGELLSAMRVRGPSTGILTIEGFTIDHHDNPDPHYGIDNDGISANVRIENCFFYAGSNADYAGVHAGMTDPAAPGSGAFWIHVTGCVFRHKVGGAMAMYDRGVLFEGNGGNAGVVEKCLFLNSTHGIAMQNYAGHFTIANGVTFLNNDFEVNNNAISIFGTNLTTLASIRIMFNRCEAANNFLQCNFTGGPPSQPRPPILFANHRSALCLNHILNPQGIKIMDWDWSISPDNGMLVTPRGTIFWPQGGAEDGIAVINPGGNRGVAVHSGDATSDVAVRMMWSGTGTIGRISSQNGAELEVTCVRGISATPTAARNLCQSVTITGAANTGVWTFDNAETNVAYTIQHSVTGQTGVPSVGAFTIIDVAKTINGVTITLSAAPAGSASVTYDLLLIRGPILS